MHENNEVDVFLFFIFVSADILRDAVRAVGVHEDGEVHVDVCGRVVPAQHDRCGLLLGQAQLPPLLLPRLGSVATSSRVIL